MNTSRLGILLVVALLFCIGCKPRAKGSSDLQRKEAALADSEAQFAVTMRQWDRAESLYAKAAQLSPDNGQYWLGLGAMRVRLNKRDAAKDAYKSALKAFETEAAQNKANVEPWLKQVEVLALLGRVDEGRATLEKVGKRFPADRTVRSFIDNKHFDRMLADPAFKQSAVN